MPQWKVTELESGLKLLSFLRQKLGPGPSARLLKRSLEANLCQINNRVERFGSISVGRGDIVNFTLETFQPAVNQALIYERIKTLYADEHLLIIDKPDGISSEDPVLLESIKGPSGYLKLVHRLDRETTGVLIFARSADTLKAMIELFRNRKVQKKYLALVDGVPKTKNGFIKNYLGKLHEYEGQNLWGPTDKTAGVLAETEWSIEKQAANCALVACVPLTGRTHQLRVHLSGMGHPILGDKQYAKRFRCTYRPQRCLLHALEIHFPHPITHQSLTVTAPLPDDFLEVLRILFAPKAAKTQKLM